MNNHPPRQTPVAPGNKVCAIIVAYRCGEAVEKTFHSVVGQVEKVLLVDNGSGDATSSVLLSLQGSHPEKTEVITLPENAGIAGGLNAGARRSMELGFPWILTLDHDSQADSGMVNALLAAWARHPERENVMIVAPRYFDMNGKIEGRHPLYKGVWPRFLRFTGPEDLIHPSEVIASGNLVRTVAFREIGYFDEALFIDCVDSDYCLRLFLSGYKIIIPRDAFLYHEIGKAVAKPYFRGKKWIASNHVPLRRYYSVRNRILMIRKYGVKVPSFGLLSLADIVSSFITVIILEGDVGQKIRMMARGIRDGLMSNTGKREA